MLFALLMSCCQLSFGMQAEKKRPISFDITSSDLSKEQIAKLQKKSKSLKDSERSLEIELTYQPADSTMYGDPLFPLFVIIKIHKNKIFDIHDLEEKIQEETHRLRSKAKKFLGIEEKKTSVFRDYLIPVYLTYHLYQ